MNFESRARKQRRKTKNKKSIWKHDSSCDDSSCDDPSCHDPSCDDPSCDDPSCHDPLCHDPLCHDPSCHDPSCDDPSCHDPSCHDPSCDDPSCHDPSCHDMYYLVNNKINDLFSELNSLNNRKKDMIHNTNETNYILDIGYKVTNIVSYIKNYNSRNNLCTFIKNIEEISETILSIIKDLKILNDDNLLESLKNYTILRFMLEKTLLLNLDRYTYDKFHSILITINKAINNLNNRINTKNNCSFLKRCHFCGKTDHTSRDCLVEQELKLTLKKYIGEEVENFCGKLCCPLCDHKTLKVLGNHTPSLDIICTNKRCNSKFEIKSKCLSRKDLPPDIVLQHGNYTHYLNRQKKGLHLLVVIYGVNRKKKTTYIRELLLATHDDIIKKDNIIISRRKKYNEHLSVINIKDRNKLKSIEIPDKNNFKSDFSSIVNNHIQNNDYK